MAGRIQELKIALQEQNELIKTLRANKDGNKKAITTLYTPLVRYKEEYISGRVAAEESGQYPDVRMEDLHQNSPDELIQKVGRAFIAVCRSLSEVRSENREIYSELDISVTSALDEWKMIRSSEDNDKRAKAFREDLFVNAAPVRPTTPPLQPLPSVATPPVRVDTLTPPSSADKKDGREKKTSESKAGTAKVGTVKLDSPTTATRPSKK